APAPLVQPAPQAAPLVQPTPQPPQAIVIAPPMAAPARPEPSQPIPPPAQHAQPSGSVVRPSVIPPRMPVKEAPAQAARRLTMTMLLGRIGDAVDLSTLRASPNVPDAVAQQIDRAAREQAQAMRDEGEAPQDVDLDAIVRDAMRELVGLGA